ncbi:MAG: type I DNA topoisomerase [Chloroflexi bacterium]|nr:type I DNA topoisomerase [Chloroflexota bacterium]
MSKKLVIVESPAKARTVGKFLGDGYAVKASIGHIRDLPQNRFGVDVENDFAPRYVIPAKKKSVVKALKEEAKAAEVVFLATDPDREGEAISWHLVSALGLKNKPVHRVEFHEITKDAIGEAFAHPRSIDESLVDAQQARRVLDRLVGYTLSPLLRRKITKKGLSAGRVQSVAVRLVVEREREIAAFVPVEYWSLEADLAKKDAAKRKTGRQELRASLAQIDGDKIDVKNRTQVEGILANLDGARYVVSEVRRKEVQRNPSPPFTTSTMQQEASRKIGFTAKRTMAVAQGLYEGVNVGGEGAVGLITYMRTDSTNIAASAQAEARGYIAQRFGASYVPEKPRVYKTKSKGAQEAHEAVRPTSITRDPESIKHFLAPEQYKLYRLIWQRMLASQMASAIMDTTSVDILAGRVVNNMPYLFRATGSTVKFPGFMIVYKESKDEGEVEEEEAKKVLPPLAQGEELDLLKLVPEQHFTSPPPRYTEATLVKALEEYGIGRPSTYAPTLSTIQDRGYVERIDKRLKATEIGTIVNDLLVKHFPEIVDTGFTAHMEEELDEIAAGERSWVPVIREFYDPFSATVVRADSEMERVELKPEPAGEDCEKCGQPMLIKFGRYGKFIACSGYPKCRNAKSFAIKIGVNCPECGGELVEKKTRRKRIFFSCGSYPKCTFGVWNRPLPNPCPSCGGLLTINGKNAVTCTKCGEVSEASPVPVAAGA